MLHIYAGNLYGGIERLLATFARERRLATQMEPAFALCFPGRLADELTAAGTPATLMGGVRFSRPWTLWRARWRLARLLRRQKFDVAVTHAAWPHAAFAGTVRRCGVPLVFWAHDPLTGGADAFESRAAAVPPALVIANSQFTAATCPNVFPKTRTEVVYLPVSPHEPVEPTAARAVRAELNTPAQDVVFLQACRLERWKGHSVLIEALGRLKHVPGWTAWVAGGAQKAGEAEYLAELSARAAELGIADRVRFLGQRSDVPRLLAAADVLCQPNSGPEPFGIAFVEALYAGRPVVTSDLGGGREVVDPSCGVLVPPGEPAAVAAALAELISDPARRAALGAGGPKRAEALCAPARQLDRVANLLQKVVL
ncbi:glycosyltransferase family 4 protein [Gemmata sp. JC673]|uniref:Glycosyltransferase family 4 protein n=1 Tax=Gemmata algarum TaxID=2975278 RepID=A0ABU5EWV7_9BACT|nr:glycosyltransferase family 4 protein [Gemmata algarum]